MSLPSIGFIGAGMMGAGMVGSLLWAGHRVGLLAHKNRQPIKTLVQRGAEEASDATALVKTYDVLITCLPNADIVEVLAEAIVPNLRKGQIWIDTTTSRPQTSERIAAEVDARGAVFGDAPITGGPQQAQDGALASLVGCSEECFPTIERIVGTYSKIVRRFGAPGRGHAAKLLNNLVTQGTMVLLADAFHAADRYGIDLHTLYDVMLCGAARSGTLEKAVGPALGGDYGGSRFSIANASKDMGYARDLLSEIAENHTDIAASLSTRLAAHVGSGQGGKFVSAMLDPQFSWHPTPRNRPKNMTFQPHGKHLIAGDRVLGESTFTSSPALGPAHDFSVGTPEIVDAACQAAEEAFWSYGYSSREDRAVLLNRIADEIEVRAEAITEIGTQETGLPSARIQGERGRTTGQLRLFAEHILQGDYLEARHDPALPDRQPLPRPDLKMVQRPIGPVAVFGASNFPLAFSTAGGDTAAALAAGCPVVVKGHPAHPGTGEIIAEALHAAIRAAGMHVGVFSLIQSDAHDVGTLLAEHPLIKAVGFTGSLRGGRALFDLCAQRPEPIPFFGELGSVNPMFLLPNALTARGGDIGTDWAGSLTLGAGQFCTNPGIAVVIDGPDADAFVAQAKTVLDEIGPQTMLTDGIALAYRDGQKRIAASDGVRDVLTSMCDQRQATPNLYETDGATWLSNHALAEEVFGPLGLVVRVTDMDQMMTVAKSLEGQLICTLHINEPDTVAAQRLMPILERKAGRLLVNGFPTGVEVVDGMVHGGPYPASTNFGATSVGTLSIRRFLRPVCYQNMPDALMPT